MELECINNLLILNCKPLHQRNQQSKYSPEKNQKHNPTIKLLTDIRIRVPPLIILCLTFCNHSINRVQILLKAQKKMNKLTETASKNNKFTEIKRTNHMLVGVELFAEVGGLEEIRSWKSWCQLQEMGSKLEWSEGEVKIREMYILIEEVTVDGPIESLSESSAVEDLNPLLLRCSPR